MADPLAEFGPEPTPAEALPEGTVVGDVNAYLEALAKDPVPELADAVRAAEETRQKPTIADRKARTMVALTAPERMVELAVASMRPADLAAHLECARAFAIRQAAKK